MESGLFGNAAELAAASLGLIANGSTEDGYEAINFGFNSYSFRSTAAVNFILITDEDRDVLGGINLDSAAMRSLFNGNNALLNAVVSTGLEDGSGNTAVGVDSQGNAYTSNGAGGFNTAPGGVAVSGAGSTIADYVNLAFATGGAAWDLNQLRAGGSAADAFTAAFVDIKVDEIVNQTPTANVPLPAAWLLMMFGLSSLAAFKKRKV